MADLILGSAVKTIVYKVIALASDQINTALEWREDLRRFRFIMKMVAGVLNDAEQKHVNGHPNDLKTWIEELRGIAEEAEDVFAELAYEQLRQEVAARKLKWEKVSYLFTQSKPIDIAFRLRIADKVKNLNLYLTDVNEWANRLGLQYRLAHTTNIVELSQSVRQTHSYQDSSTVIGRELERKKIISMLVDSSSDRDQLSVISIVGMGGLGKTTLAKKVRVSDEIHSYFGRIMWVCVSENFDVQRILGEMLESLTKTSCTMKNTDAIIQKIKEELGEKEENREGKIKQGLEGTEEKKEMKRYLLILDDVWNEVREKWEELRSYLLAISTAVGNRVMVTTRSRNVAEIMVTRYPEQSHSLKVLEDGECWSIIREKALGQHNPLDFEEVGLNIAKECKGVPLVANVIGGILCNKQDVSEWESFQKKISEWDSLGDERIRNILKLSFNRLPIPALKQCFAFCSIFAKDFVVEKEMLIQLWMAEGFLQPSRGSSMEDVGEKYINYLVACSLLQEEERDSAGKVKSCKMHHFIHDLAQCITECETVIIDGGSQVAVSNLVRHLNLIDGVPPANLGIVADQLRTLLLKHRCPNSLLGNLSRVRALSFCHTDTKKLPPCLGNLKSLSFLDISGTRIKKFPISLSRLYNLQTFRFMDCKDLKRRPKGIENLLNLRHIYFNQEKLMPARLGRLTNLQTLQLFCVGRQGGFKIEELGSLSQLRGRLEITNLERVKNKSQAKKCRLHEKAIEELTLRFGRRKKESTVHYKDVLEGLQPPPKLKLLRIHRYQGSTLPSWVSALRNLEELKITHCRKLKGIPRLEASSSLRRVEIAGCFELSRIEDGAFVSNASQLEELTIHDCPNLERISVDGLSSLQRLDIWYCGKLCSIGESLSISTCLKDLNLKSCNNLRCIPRLDGLTSLKSLYIYGCGQLECLPTGLSSCTALESLRIEGCKNLVFTPKELTGLRSLVHLVITLCPNLRSDPPSPSITSLDCLKTLTIYSKSAEAESLFGSIQPLPSIEELVLFATKDDGLTPFPQHIQCYTCLKELSIRGFQVESLPMSQPPHGLGELSSLTKLTITSSNLISIPQGLKVLPSLVELEIFNCPKLRSFPAGESNFNCLTSLRRLTLGPFSPDLEEFPDLSSFPPTPNLEYLHFNGWEKPTQLPHLGEGASSLKELEIYKFDGVETLPEWLENLSSLQSLEIEYCKNLKHLPSAKAILHLNRLNIFRCRALQERCAKDKGPEWSKISHIPNIKLGFMQIKSEDRT